MLSIKSDILKEIYQKRPEDAKKYDFGLLTVIGGSEFYTGSPAFAALAAFRAGADMVHIIAPERAANIIASFSPNLAAYPLKGDWLTLEHLPILLERAAAAKQVSNSKTAVVIGGGLGRSEETKRVIVDFLKEITVPCVIDADAIHAVAKNPQVIKGKKILITPHLQEFYVLTGKKVFGISEEEKINLVREEAEKLDVSILLKGKTDVIVSSTGEVAKNQKGSPYMTVGGTGDTLAGIAGSLIARGVESFKAGAAASYINAAAGQRAAKKLGEAMLASDLIEEIPAVLPKF